MKKKEILQGEMMRILGFNHDLIHFFIIKDIFIEWLSALYNYVNNYEIDLTNIDFVKNNKKRKSSSIITQFITIDGDYVFQRKWRMLEEEYLYSTGFKDIPSEGSEVAVAYNNSSGHLTEALPPTIIEHGFGYYSQQSTPAYRERYDYNISRLTW